LAEGYKRKTMTNNDLLRRLRYALKLDAEAFAGLCALAEYELKPVDVLKLLKKEEEPGFVLCDDAVMGAFLDGLIISRRGASEKSPSGAEAATALNNNLILRKLRIALELNEEAMRAVLAKAGVQISKSELSAMFRAKGHKNYKPCGDQFLRNFIRGLTLTAGLEDRK
jgi:uncharacterized protein YehS (DUF1456 family)